MQKLSPLMNALANKSDGLNLALALQGIYDRMSSQAFTSGAIAAGTTATTVKTAAAVQGISGGKLITIPAIDDLFVPKVGFNVGIGKTNVLCLYLDSTGAATSAFGVEAATSTAGLMNPKIKMPPLPVGKMMIGFVIISANAAAWVAGTNNFATAGNYTVTFVNTTGMFDPTATI